MNPRVDLEQVTKLFASVAAVVAAVPGLAALLVAFHYPADLKGLFGALPTVVTVLLVLVLYVQWDQVRGYVGRNLSQLVGCAVACMLITLLLLYLIHTRCVIPIPTEQRTDDGAESILLPLWLSGDIEKLVGDGGRSSVFDHGRDQVVRELADMPAADVAKTVTVGVLMSLTLVVALTTTCAFTLLAFSALAPPLPVPPPPSPRPSPPPLLPLPPDPPDPNKQGID